MKKPGHGGKVKGSASEQMDQFLNIAMGGYLPLSLLLACVTLIIYGQVRGFDFIVWDDPLYVTRNLNIQTGFHWESIHWAFTTHHGALWHPLTWLSHMLDYQLFGLSPAGYHLMNLFWHLVNGLLLFRVLQLMTREVWPSFLVAVLFVVHPLRAESVAWVTERKDVMSTFFWLLTTWFYVRYVKASDLKHYIPVVVSLGLGLMVKPMLVTLPFALMLLDFWPLRRVQTYRSWIPLLREKIPLFVLMIISIVIAIWAHHAATAIAPFTLKPLPLRIGNAVFSYVAYLYKSFWPVSLSVIYPFDDSLPLWKQGAAAVILGGLSWFAWSLRHRFPYTLTGWLWFLGTLVPVINIVQAGAVAMADRFMYIPSIGLFIIVAWGVRDLISMHPSYKGGLLFTCASAVIVLSAACYVQVQHWKDSITLFQHALRVREDNFLAHGCLGAAWIQQRNPEHAERHLRRALEINPDYPEALNDLGTILVDTGRYQEALSHFSNAIHLNPRYAEAHNNLALALTNLNRFPEAIEHYRIAISLNPRNPITLNNLGAAFARMGRLEEAKPYFLQALTIQPGYDEAYNNLGLLFYQQQDYANSRAYFEAGLGYNSNNPTVYFFLGLIAAAQDRDQEAADRFTQALRLDPNFQEAEKELKGMQKKHQRR